MESTQRLGNNTYNETFGYDNGLRLTGVTLTRVSDGATLFASTPGYDAVNNVVSVSTTLPGGTDNQGFCYDEQDRLTWAATSGAKPCGGTVTAGTLSSAAYAQTFGYDNLNRLTSGPAGTYTYGDSAHLHAVTAVGTGYTASYDAAGNMTCRAPTSSQTCSGTITGAKLTIDNEGRLKSWQNAQTSPTATESILYDGEHNRVKLESVVNGTTTTTVYVGGVEEVKTSGGVTTTTTYYMLGGQRIAVAVNGTLSYLASDLLSSTTVALDGAGNVSASQLFSPYGTSRYSNGTMPTDRGFTGQHADAVTGLDYYNSRYYDPIVGQFASADEVFDGLNRYAYVGGNPETKADPTGHRLTSDGGGGPDSSSAFDNENSRQAIDRDKQLVRRVLGGIKHRAVSVWNWGRAKWRQAKPIRDFISLALLIAGLLRGHPPLRPPPGRKFTPPPIDGPPVTGPAPKFPRNPIFDPERLGTGGPVIQTPDNEDDKGKKDKTSPFSVFGPNGRPTRPSVVPTPAPGGTFIFTPGVKQTPPVVPMPKPGGTFIFTPGPQLTPPVVPNPSPPTIFTSGGGFVDIDP